MAAERERVAVILEAEGIGPPLPVRLKRFLKRALRSFGLRCKWIQSAEGWRFGAELHQAEGPGVAELAEGQTLGPPAA